MCQMVRSSMEQSKAGKGDSAVYGARRAGIQFKIRGFLSGLVAKTLLSQCKGHGFNPCSENWIPHAPTKKLHPSKKDPTCRNEDQRSHVPKLRPSTAR